MISHQLILGQPSKAYKCQLPRLIIKMAQPFRIVMAVSEVVDAVVAVELLAEVSWAAEAVVAEAVSAVSAEVDTGAAAGVDPVAAVPVAIMGLNTKTLSLFRLASAVWSSARAVKPSRILTRYFFTVSILMSFRFLTSKY